VNIGFSQDRKTVNPQILNKVWDARWITHPDISGYEDGVYLFRKTLDINDVTKEYIVNISADNRYKLYVNGQFVCNGPARGSLMNWYFEIIDIAPFLKKGRNSICAVVWNFSSYKPLAQISYLTGFIMQGNSESEDVINTNSAWKVFKDTSYSITPIDYLFAYLAGPAEQFNCTGHPWNWMDISFSDENWENAKEMQQGVPYRGMSREGMPDYILYPREIPLMKYEKQSFKEIREYEGIENPGKLIDCQNLTIPANSRVTILFDQKELTTAYPCLKFSNGKGSKIKITYAESFFIPGDRSDNSTTTKNQLKGNRNEIEGKELIGNYDVFIPDGGEDRVVETLWWRTFRYVQLDISTSVEPLILHEFFSYSTGYPFKENAGFKCNDPIYSEIWETGWRTQRLCAGETYFDCPYYEQMQYIGDTRLQGLISFYISGDSLLWKKSIFDFYNSRLPFGLIQCDYPSSYNGIIPTYSLLWIPMVYDYHMHCDDAIFVRKLMPAIIDNLQWFEDRLDSNGLLPGLEWWCFIDWAKDKNWKNGVPPSDSRNNSAIINLLFTYALDKASELMKYYGYTENSITYDEQSKRIKTYILNHCWDEKAGLFADNADKNTYSQHTQALAILVDLFPAGKQKEIMLKTYNNDSIVQCTYYFRFYLAEAMKRAGLGSHYTEMLEPWKEMLNNGLTTFAEGPEPTRSDCHAWSASPNYHFLSLVCGIEPVGQGFKRIRIAPNFGNLEWIEAKMPLKKGLINIDIRRSKNGNINGVVGLPDGTTGIFEYNGKRIELEGNSNRIEL
jgi:hypothetical protein